MMPRLTHLAAAVMDQEGSVLCSTPWPFILTFTRLEVDLQSACCGAWLVLVGMAEPDQVECVKCHSRLALPTLLREREDLDCWWAEVREWLELLLTDFTDPLTATLQAHEVADDLLAVRAHFERAGAMRP